MGVTAFQMEPKPDGQYAEWEIQLALRYPLSLSEMRWPSAPLGRPQARPIARWGIECRAGWRALIAEFLDRLEHQIEALPLDRRDAYRIVRIKEKLGRLTVNLAAKPTEPMWETIEEAGDLSTTVCEVCGEPGELAERPLFLSVRCDNHADWRPRNRPPG
jgi:hypothetical protein